MFKKMKHTILKYKSLVINHILKGRVNVLSFGGFSYRLSKFERKASAIPLFCTYCLIASLSVDATKLVFTSLKQF